MLSLEMYQLRMHKLILGFVAFSFFKRFKVLMPIAYYYILAMLAIRSQCIFKTPEYQKVRS